MKGWIKICRSIASHWLWRNANYFQWWVDMLLMASWQGEKRLVGRQLITLQRGQFIASIDFLAKRWHRSKPTIIAFLKLLQQDNMITKATNNRIPIITICNYSAYQSLDTCVDNLTDCDTADCAPQQQQSLYRCVDKLKPQSLYTCVDSLSDTKSSDCEQPQDASLDRSVYTSHYTIKEYNNIVVVDKCARAKFREEVFSEIKMQQACMSLALTGQQYEQLANEVISDWEFANEADWSYKHFLNTMRRKAVAMRKSQNQSTKRDKINDLWKQ